MKTSLFYLPSIGSRAEIEAGMAGLRGDLYTRMLAELSGQARLADDLGYDSISFTEHHFQIEGMELSNNPVLLDLYIAMQTKRIRVGQLGIVLPAENPLRVAENIAMLDHMTGGRANAGFARGYQRRWVDIMAQQTHGIHGAAPNQHDEIDAANRAAFEENFRLIRKCWTEDLIAFDGTYWKVPADGTPWRLPATDMFGGGVEDGIVKAVAVVPKPLQKPHPPLFQPFASSEASIRWCAQEGVTAILPPLHRKTERRLYEVYAATSGRALGDGVGILRDLVIADTDAEAQALWENSSRFAAKVWFEPFGFRRGMVDPDDGSMPSPEEFLRDGYALVGSVDTVCRQLEAAAARVPLDWLFCWMFNGMIPHEKLMRTIELFATQVLPRFGVKPAA
ncbi:alkanesulfonate monooxygenase SsuD/methylene tetrahydromethanopterin reductase-like flavin-dependent oxidoreductase (luciferase family) [Constrictibacter sp. MBR-5]|uniref:LLM class flavin-dependent oxidoreductase n=1 Tax=Constrictibacter sp. MBR-5 TaxID=3156467 RepID=UPI0033939F95